VPDPGTARATYDKFDAHRLLQRLGLPSPPTVLPGEAVAGYPVMVKPRQGSGARSIHRADDAAAADARPDARNDARHDSRRKSPRHENECGPAPTRSPRKAAAPRS